MKQLCKTCEKVVEVNDLGMHVGESGLPCGPSQQIAGPTGLTCSCCSGLAWGRQWHNRDEGFGICKRCAGWLASEDTPEEMRMRYGIRGVHYALEGESK